MTAPTFTIQESDTHHLFILGATRPGKNIFLQAQAKRLGVTYEELLQQLEPTDEQKEQQRMRVIEEDQIEERRLNSVREAFWCNTPDGHHDLDQLHDVLALSEIIEEPTREQVKAFFMMLPADILGAALSWGFSDTEVGEDLYKFVKQNKQAVREAISPISNQDKTP